MLYVVRHGQTDWNLENKIQGQADIPLNDNGIKQATLLQHELKDIAFCKIISSPLLRAKKTAEIIRNNSEIPLIIDDRITERNMGEFEGSDKNKFDGSSFWNPSLNLTYVSAENVLHLLHRVYNFLDEFKPVYERNNLLIVTHTGVIPAICSYFNGIPKDNNLFTYHIKNCEVIKF